MLKRDMCLVTVRLNHGVGVVRPENKALTKRPFFLLHNGERDIEEAVRPTTALSNPVRLQFPCMC
ncbi:hypothetical protein DIPPA_03223 [Diplonema papillatum]|nr:hypothetical protein DIPPA_03223 [Diplonema papillatum]